MHAAQQPFVPDEAGDSPPKPDKTDGDAGGEEKDAADKNKADRAGKIFFYNLCERESPRF